MNRTTRMLRRYAELLLTTQLVVLGWSHSPDLAAQPWDWDHAHLPDQGMADVVNDLVHDRSSNALFAVGSYQTASAITSQAFGLPASNGMDGFLVRLNTNGQPLAKMLLTGPGDASLASVCMGPNGTLYAAGWFEGTASFISATGIQTTISSVGSQREAVVLAIDASGELVWSHVLGSPGDDRATGVAVTSGGVFVHGEFFSKLTHQGVASTPGGNGKTNVFLTKLTLSGTHEWDIEGKSNDDNEAGGISADDNAIAITGVFHEPTITWTGTNLGSTSQSGPEDDNVYVLLVDPNGQIQWKQAIGNPSNDLPAGAIALDCDRVIAGGSLEEGASLLGNILTVLSGGDPMLFITWFDRTTGALDRKLLAKANSGGDQPRITDLHLLPDGDLLVAGRSDDDLTFTDGTLVRSTGQDALLMRVSWHGNVEWAMALSGSGDDEARAVTGGPNSSFFAGGLYRDALDLSPYTASGSSGRNLFLGKALDPMALIPGPLAAYWRHPGRICANGPTISLDPLVPGHRDGHADAVTTNAGGLFPGSMLGAPDGAVGYLDNNGDSVVLDLTDTLRVGDVLRITFRRSLLSTGTARPMVRGSLDGTTWTTFSALPENASTQSVTRAMPVSGNMRFLSLSKAGSLSSADIAVDAVTYFTGSRSGGLWSGNGVTGNQFDPGLAGPGTHTLTYTVGQGTCTQFLERSIQVGTPPVAGTIIGPNGLVCPGTSTTVHLSGYVGDQVQWSTSGSSNGPWNISGSTADSLVLGALTSDVHVRARIWSPGCGAVWADTLLIEVGDTIPPTILNCPADTTLHLGPDSCTVSFMPPPIGWSDNCSSFITANSSVQVINTGPLSPAPLPIGAGGLQLGPGHHQITRTFTDAAGNSSTCSYVVHVLDTLPPEAVCPGDTTLSLLPDSCSARFTFPVVPYWDNCSANYISAYLQLHVDSALQPAAIDVTTSAFADLPIGTHEVTETYADTAGNSSTCRYRITVLDQEAPWFICPLPATVLLPATNGCDAVMPNLIDSVLHGDCSAYSVEQTPAPGTLVSGSFTSTMTFTDIHGNVSYNIDQISVVDLTAPMIGCPSDMVVQVAPGQCDTVLSFVATAADGCGPASLTYSHAPGTAFAPGMHTVTVTATDDSGNATSCSFTIDVLPPVEPFLSYPAASFCQGSGFVAPSSFGPAAASAYFTGPPGVVVNATTGIIDLVASQPGTYSMGYVVQGPCDASDWATVTIVAPPQAGGDALLQLCSTDGPVDLFLALGGTPEAGGQWTDPNGDLHTGIFDPGTDPAGIYEYTVNGTTPCGPATAEVSLSVVPATIWYADTDNDGAGDPSLDSLACGQPVGYVDNANDQCPQDPLKTEPGTCGCGVSDQDSDGDGLPDCVDGCPSLPGVPGDPCDDGDPSTGDDVITPSCTCEGQLIDCVGIPGGTALPGTACDDGDPNTGGDVWDASCNCVGLVIDCEGTTGGTSLPGTACDDGDPNTGGDTWDASCNCVGLLIDCEGIAGGAALPGTTCDDGDPNTGGDTWDASCNCVGLVIDCEGTAGGAALPGTPCDDGDPNTGGDNWDASCNCVGLLIDCEGTAGGTALPGTPCDDGDPNTGGDTWDASCNCVGLLIDCEGTAGGTAMPGTPCDDGDPNTGGDTWDASCNCVGLLIDCEGTAGGTAMPGTPCDDGDPNTGGDTWDASCNCAGLLIDCEGTAGGTALPGTTCDDGDPDTGGDSWDASCNCAGLLIDCEGIAGGAALPGTTCDDGDPNTGGDTWDASCNCAGLLIDCEGTAGGTALPGTACDDGDPNTGGDTWDASCNCVGLLIDCEGIAGGAALPGTTCDDGDPNTGGDTWDASCNCVGQIIDCEGTTGGTSLPGTPCDDGDPNTGGDTWDASCNCVGLVIDCEGTAGGAALPGTACDDGDPDTGGDTWDASCNCVGLLIDCEGTTGGTAMPGTPCDDGDPGTGGDTWDASCNCVGQLIDCEGTAGGPALLGTPCDDGDPNTGGDTWDASCNCAGQLIDCEGTTGGTAMPGTACDDGDPNTGGDTWDASCNCAGLLIDCEGIAGGSALPGTTCDDGDPNTGGDTWDASCNCVGQLIDCEGTAGGAALPGTVCDDGDPDTGGDTWDASCNCVGQLIDCEGIAGGSALPGTTCDDGDPDTGGDTWDASCNCVGLLIDCEGTTGGTAMPGTACDDGDPDTGGDTWDASCNCVGLLIDCEGTAGGSALPGTTCDDGDATTGNDTWDASCNCAGLLIDCEGTAGGSALPGTPCDDGDPNTGGDTWDASCNCAGQLIDCEGIAGGSALPGTTCDDGDPDTGGDTWDASCNCVGLLIDCEGTTGGTAMPGTACDDGDPDTGGDTWDASCNCVGLVIDCEGTAGGTAMPGTACDDGDPDTGGDTWDASCNCVGLVIDCEGTAGGTALPGTACDDGDPNTGGDTWDASCNCAGLLIDCEGTTGGTALPGTACDDGDPNTGGDTWDASCNCVGLLIDCEGTSGGTAMPGTACDDGDPDTGGDTWDASCNCVGLLIDCEGNAGGSALPGTACDDGDPNTGGDTWDASCNCVGLLIDCEGIAGGAALPGTTCDDGDPNTGGDTWDASCNCVGLLIDCEGTTGGTAMPGTACDDGDPDTGGDTWDASCNCVGLLIDCEGTAGGAAMPGTACDDGDPDTGGDTWDASCNCVGLLIDCEGTTGGTSLPGTPCDDGDPNTGSDSWDASCNCVGLLIDCEGTVGGTALPGTACDDGDPNTGGDTWDASCNCSGLLIDCEGTTGGAALPGTTCDDGDPNTGGDTWDASCNCVGQIIDCEGTAGGTSLPGTACDDGDPNTGGDTWDASCNCVGLLIDCEGTAGGTALPGTTCDDGDPNTGGDTWDASCNCVGLLIDCEGTAGGTALPGTACDDGDPNTGGDTWDASCNCVGLLIDCEGTAGGTAMPGTACDDGDPNTGGDTWDASCNCSGLLIDCEGTAGGTALPGTACDDGDPNTGGDTWDASCNCVGQIIDCEGTAGGTALPGTACDDGDPNTGGDTWDASCNCVGTSNCDPPMIGPLTTNGPACLNGSLQITAITSGTGPLSYSWNGPGVVQSGADSATVTYSSVTTGLYTLEVSNACGLDTGSIHVDVLSAPEAGEDSVHVTCTGNGTILLGDLLSGHQSGGTWSPADSHDPQVPGTFVYTYTLSNACGSDESVMTIQVYDVSNASWTAPAEVCMGTGPIALDPLVTGDPGGTWDGEGVAGASFDPSVGPGQYAITYSVGVSDCGSSSTQVITVLSGPDALAGEDAMVCGNTHQLGASPVQAIGNWSGPNGVQFIPGAADPSALVVVPGPGNYIFLWTVGDGQCWNTDTVQVTFLSDDISDLSVDAGPDQVLDIQSTTQLEGSSSGSSSLWTVIQGSAVFADATDPLTQVTGLGTGTNILVLTGSNGPCAERHDTLRVIVRDLFIPEGFSPNGDGVNDLFEITGISIYPDNTFQVFDRWGRPVFEEQGYANGWDGRGRSGGDLPDDTYFYVLNLEGDRTYNGYLVLKR